MIRAKEYTVKQQRLIPTDMRDMLPENDLSLLIAEIVEVLDITEIEMKFASTVGPLPYHPKMMISLLLYGYCTGVYSSRKIERNTYVDIGFNFLAGDYHPDHVSIARFRNVNLDEFEDIFLQVLLMCKKAGLVKLGKVAIDGTKIKANASIRKTKNYESVAKEYEQLEKIVNELVGKAKRIDNTEDKRYGADKRGDELPEKLRNARNRMKELERIKEEMEIEAKEIAERKDEMFQNSNRKAIFQALVDSEYGLTTRNVQNTTGINIGTVRHHLKILENHKYIGKTDKVYYVRPGDARNTFFHQILEAQENGATTIREVARVLDTSRNRVWYHIKKNGRMVPR